MNLVLNIRKNIDKLSILLKWLISSTTSHGTSHPTHSIHFYRTQWPHNGSGLVILCISIRHNGCIEWVSEAGGARILMAGGILWRPIDDICPPISPLNSQPTLPHCTLLSAPHHRFTSVKIWSFTGNMKAEPKPSWRNNNWEYCRKEDCQKYW